MKRIMLLMLAVMILLPVNYAWGQAMGKKVAHTDFASMAGESAKASMFTKTFNYEATSNILIGPAYSGGKFDMFIGYARPLNQKAYIIITANKGFINENDETDVGIRGYYELTSDGMFNFGVLASVGSMWEKMVEEGADPEWLVQAATTYGVAATLSMFGKVGFYGIFTRQMVGDPFDGKNKDLVTVGVSILM